MALDYATQEYGELHYWRRGGLFVAGRSPARFVLVLALLCGGVIGVVVLLAACGQPGAVPVVLNSPIPVSATSMVPTSTRLVQTVTPDLAATATEVDLEEFAAGYPKGAFSDPIYAAAATQAIQHAHQYQTMTALTPTPIPPPTPVPRTPPPTPTFFTGMLTDSGCIPPLHGTFPQFASCWRTELNGQWYFLAGGHEGLDTLTPSPSYQQSLLMVCPEPCRLNPLESDLYHTPHSIGDVRISAVSGPLVTLVAHDPSIHDSFVFDLTTRQWVMPTPTATPAP